MYREPSFEIPSAIELGQLIQIPGTNKKLKLKTVSRWRWVSPKSIARHEAFHTAAAPEKVQRVQCDPDHDSQGKTFFDGAFDPVMSAAPAAFGCGGCSGDHHATVSHGYDWGEAQGWARAAFHGKMELVNLIASALEEDRVLMSSDVMEIYRIFKDGFKVEMVIVDESGKEEEVVMLGYRLQKHQTGWVPTDILRRFTSDARPPQDEVALPRAA